jgi:DNA-binding NtrC family response regulator
MNAQKDRPMKVMFVDDEEGVRVSWNRYLSAHGFDVTTVEDGAKAISRLRAEPVDVVVSDLKMPGVDGVQLLEWLHDRQPETRFILLTGYGNEAVERKVRELGAFDYLNKPISPDTLAAVVTAATHLKLLDPEPVVHEEPAVETAVAEEAIPAEEPILAETPVRAKSGWRRSLEILTGLIVAPLLGLAFVVFLPIIGFGALFWMLGESLWDTFKPAAT